MLKNINAMHVKPIQRLLISLYGPLHNLSPALCILQITVLISHDSCTQQANKTPQGNITKIVNASKYALT